MWGQAQFLKAGASAKCAPGEDSWLQLKGLGHDSRELELLTRQHDRIDEGRVLLRQALVALVAFRPERCGHLLGERSAIGNAQVT